MQPRNNNETTTAAKEAIVMFRQSFLSLVCLFADMFLFCLILLTHWFENTKLLQKSEMRKEIVIELSYKGFSRASDYS